MLIMKATIKRLQSQLYKNVVGTSKRRMGARDLTYVYPSRRTIIRYLEDASYMNLIVVAEELVNKNDNVVKVGLN